MCVLESREWSRREAHTRQGGLKEQGSHAGRGVAEMEIESKRLEERTQEGGQLTRLCW